VVFQNPAAVVKTGNGGGVLRFGQKLPKTLFRKAGDFVKVLCINLASVELGSFSSIV
jgi:hypothetical protein